jgi:hypothetical protein
MDAYGETTDPETFNPWSIVNLVFHHLVSEGLHPVLGEAGDPGRPAADLLRALGITPAAEGSRQASEQTKRDLEKIRAAFDQGLFTKHCLMLRAHDLGFRDVIGDTRTFGAVGRMSSRHGALDRVGPRHQTGKDPGPRNPPRKG